MCSAFVALLIRVPSACEILEGTGIFVAELDHQTVIQPQLWPAADPVAHPDGSDPSSSSPLSSSVNELMNLY